MFKRRFTARVRTISWEWCKFPPSCGTILYWDENKHDRQRMVHLGIFNNVSYNFYFSIFISFFYLIYFCRRCSQSRARQYVDSVSLCEFMCDNFLAKFYPIFGAIAFCTTKIDDFRACLTLTSLTTLSTYSSESHTAPALSRLCGILLENKQKRHS